ncbi:MAG: GNAT family N-acetyltransferase [Chloroflexota bacterium]
MPELAITIREARAEDSEIIKQMVWAERLDPTSLKWQHFLVAEHESEIVGIGQIKQYPGCEELGSLVTKAEYQGQGIGRRMIDALEARAGRPLYLLCAEKMEAYYLRFGYETITWWDAPAFLKLKTSPLLIFQLFGVRVCIMRKNGSDPVA